MGETSAKPPLPARVVARARSTARGLRHRLLRRRHAHAMRRLEAGRPPEYHDYLETQLDRTLSKRGNEPGVGQRILVDAAADDAPASGAVLCVGCRNGLELDAFRARGLGDVRGIDIFSQRGDILVMDMHAMDFTDDSFDVVYASHSLEHALDVEQAAREMVRVARPGGTIAVEVPVAHKGSAADLVVFSGIDMLERLFADAIGDVSLREEEPASSPRNDQGSQIARLVFRVRKQGVTTTQAGSEGSDAGRAPSSAQIAPTTNAGTTGSA